MPAANATNPSNALYPAQLHQRNGRAPVNGDVSGDEQLARQLQAQFNREAVMPLVAQPGFHNVEMPYSCGQCGTTHLVRNAAHNSMFQCTRCGRQNRIALQNNRPVVIVESRSWVPVPIFCNIQ